MDYNFIGIDLGTKTSIVSHLTKNINNVLLNGIGDRETPVSVSYSDQERLFGEKSVLRMKSRPLATVSAPQRFLTNDSRQISIENQYSSAKFLRNEFHLEGDNLSLSVSPQQVLTGYLNYLQDMINNISKKTPTFYSISVPNHLGFKARKQIHKCLSATVPNNPSVVSEKLAIGLDYLVNTSKQNQNVLFIDFGHSKLTAYALQFSDESIVELTEGSYSNLGVRCLDSQLYKHFQSLIKFKLNDKNKLKLRDIAAKTRLILSANSEHTINEDFGDNDFECKITRELFQKICASSLLAVKNFIELVKRDLTGKGIRVDKIQVFGGGSRIPAFQQIVSKAFRAPILRSINNDALSRGCALYAHHKQKISKLGKLQLKEVIKSRVRVFIHHHQNQPIGNNIDIRRAPQYLENYVLYQLGSFNDQRKLTINLRKDTSVEVWIVSEEAEPMIQYYHFDKLDKQITELVCDINTRDGYPKIETVNGKLKSSGLSKSVQIIYDCVQEVKQLRARQLEFKKKDVEVISMQQKRNRIESEVIKKKATHPEVERYIEMSERMNMPELDEVIRKLSLM